MPGPALILSIVAMGIGAGKPRRSKSLVGDGIRNANEGDNYLTCPSSNMRLFNATINTIREGVIICDSSGLITVCNHAAEQILNMSAEQLIGKSILDASWRCLSEAFGDVPSSNFPAQLTLRDGQPRRDTVMGVYQANKVIKWIEINTEPIYGTANISSENASRQVEHVVTTFVDATERQQANQDATRIASIVEHSTDAVIANTIDGIFVSWNRGAEILYGYTASEVIGQHADMLTENDGGGFFDGILNAIEHGECVEGIEVVRTRKDGTKADLSLSFYPIRDKHAALIGVGCIGRDITERNAAQLRVQLSEARLAEAQRVAKLGTYELDLATNTMTWSDDVYRLYEFDPAHGYPGYEELLSRYVPSDLEKRNKLIARAIATGEQFACDSQLKLPSGKKRHVQLNAMPIRDETGKTIRMVGTVMDITDRILSEERFRVLFEYSSEPHLLLDVNGVIDCNPACVEILRCDAKDYIIGKHPSILSPEFQPDGRSSSEKSLEMDNLARAKGFHKFDWTHKRRDGVEFVAEVSLTSVTLNGQSALLCAWHDLTERLEAQHKIEAYNTVLEYQMKELCLANEKLAALSTTDGLTELANHRKFQERLAEDFRSAKRYNKPLSLLFLDVDNFKEFNDSFGHPAGDTVLRRVAHTMMELAREADLPARYGGEEFAIILPETGRAGAEALAERLRAAVEKLQWNYGSVSVSIGVSTITPFMQDHAELLQQADTALYNAKHSGRNQVACA
jgi:diguanylate cyclase (GGDEF)-like protein/PAS domain S-box-containing protein